MCVLDWAAVAAWVQAIGSIGAILAAVWIGERSSKRSRDLVQSERRRQADIIGATLAMKLRIVVITLKNSISLATNLAKEVEDGKTFTPPGDRLKVVFSLIKPEEIVAFKSQATMFDKAAGIAIIKTLDLVDDFNPSLDSAIAWYELEERSSANLAVVCRSVIGRSETLLYACGEMAELL